MSTSEFRPANLVLAGPPASLIRRALIVSNGDWGRLLSVSVTVAAATTATTATAAATTAVTTTATTTAA